MANKKKSKNIISSHNNISVGKKENAFLSIISKIGFFAPIIIFLILAYTIGFLKWGLFYERDYLIVAILGTISLLFSILLIKKDEISLNNFFINIDNKKVKILLLLNCSFILISIIFSTYKYASLLYLSKVFLVLLFFFIGAFFSINEKFKSIFFSFLNILSWIFAGWVFLGILYITVFPAFNSSSFFLKFLANFSPGVMDKDLLSSIFGYPNTLAAFIGSFIFVNIFLFYKEKTLENKYFQILKLFILVLGFFMTQSRASFVILVISLSLFYFVYLFFLGGKSKKISFVVLILLILFLSSFLFVPSRNFISSIIFPKTLQVDGEYSIQDRINLIKDGLVYFSKNPIIGTGVGTLKYNFTLYLKSSNLKSQTIDPHSFLITELGETGIVGTLLLFSLISLLFFNIFKKIKSINSYYIPIIFAAIFGILHSFIDWDWLYILPLLNTVFLFGFVYGNSIFLEFPSVKTTTAVQTKKTFSLKFLSIASIIILLFLSYFLIARINYDETSLSGDNNKYFASKIIPYNVDYLMLKARISYLSGSDSSVVKNYLEKSTHYAKNYAIPWQSYSDFMLSTNDPGALNAALKATELSPYDYYSNYLLSKAYYLAQDYKKAEQFALKSSEIKPDFIYSQIALGQAEIKLGNLQEAISVLKKAWDKDWGNLEATLSLSNAYELSKNWQSQFLVLRNSFLSEGLSNNEEVATLFKKFAPCISLTGIDATRQITMDSSDTLTLNFKIEGANIQKASKISLTFEDLQTKQFFNIADLNINSKAYEFVFAPGNYKVFANLLTEDASFIKILKGNVLNNSSVTVFVNSGNNTRISADKAAKLKLVALNNLKVESFYFPADYVLALLSANETEAYGYLEKAFVEQNLPVGNAAVFSLLNNFIELKTIKGIKNVSIGTHEPVTLLIDLSNLNTTLLDGIEIQARGENNVYHYLGTLHASNFKNKEYTTFLRTWDLIPGKYDILFIFSNSFILKYKLNQPVITYTLEILNKDFNAENIDNYLKDVEKNISEDKADLNYLYYIRGYFNYTQKKYLDSFLDLRNASESPELTDAKKKYLSLLPSVKLENVLYKDIYLDSPFLASWDILKEDSLLNVDQIFFSLYNKKTDKTIVLPKTKITDGKIASFNFFDNTISGEFELFINYFGEEVSSKYGNEGWAIPEKTGIYITLKDTNMPSNFRAEMYAKAQEFYPYFGKIVILKDSNFICIEGIKNDSNTFIDVLARNNATEGWAYLEYTQKDNLISLKNDEKNKPFGNNSEYCLLVKDKNNNLIFVPLIGPINIK